MGRKWVMCPFWEGELDPHLTQYRHGRGLPPYQVESWSIQPFGHNRHGPKIGGCALFGRELGPRLTQSCLGRGIPPYQVASKSIQPFGHNRHGPKTGGCAPLGWRAGSPSNTKSPEPRPTSIPSFILIDLTVWPQYTNVTDMTGQTDRQTDNGPIA